MINVIGIVKIIDGHCRGYVDCFRELKKLVQAVVLPIMSQTPCSIFGEEAGSTSATVLGLFCSGLRV